MANNSTPLKAEIISVGTEILLGYITDTNATYLSQRLPELGIGNYRVTTIGDNVAVSYTHLTLSTTPYV